MLRHLYLHIPFCHRICPYCSFYKHQHGSTDLAAFVEAMLVEARQKADSLQPDTVYFGGGTPTALSETHLSRLLAGLNETLDLSQVTEFTMEANPRTVTESKAAMMRAMGINRISLGIQAWDEATLRTLGRDHAADEAEETYRILRAAGFPSVNVDLMFSIPGQSAETWRGTLERTLALQPDHISAYNLNYEEDTEFFQRLRRGQYLESEDRDAEFFYLALDLLEAAGYEHYEISNYARPGKRSRHNESYWLGEDYAGLGPSAYSTVGGRRWQNVADTTRYIELLTMGQSAAVPGEDLTPDQRRTERFGLELRTARGLPLPLIQPASQSMLETLRREGLLLVENGQVRLTRAGKPLVDSVAVALMG
ncbi:MAG: radical SAM family heme chaperone HemW [Prosthecobacter sp.]|nr:radical SAM family heme chaperone HemW [Prosthecobacter sp.]